MIWIIKRILSDFKITFAVVMMTGWERRVDLPDW